MAILEQDMQIKQREFRKELGLRNLVTCQILNIVGLYWVGTAAKLGPSHVAFWLLGIALFYLPSAAVVIYLNRIHTLEGGLYEWTRLGFNEFAGFLVGWNLWLNAVAILSYLGIQTTTMLAYVLGSRAAWIAESKWVMGGATLVVLGGLILISLIGLGLGKWIQDFGGVVLLLVFLALIALPFRNFLTGRPTEYPPFTLSPPAISLLSLNLLGKMSFGAMSGFDSMAIFAGECRDATRAIRRSVIIAAPIIAAMSVLGTSSVVALVPKDKIDLVSPISQALTMGIRPGDPGAALIPLVIAVLLFAFIAAQVLTFATATRLPLAAGWDRLLPDWFGQLHPRRRTPTHSILFVGAVALVMGTAGVAGAGQQEAFQLLQNASGIFYALAYLAMFALPLVGRQREIARPAVWLQAAAISGFLMTAMYLVLSLFPIIEVPRPLQFTLKIGGFTLLCQVAAVGLFFACQGRSRRYVGVRNSSYPLVTASHWRNRPGTSEDAGANMSQTLAADPLPTNGTVCTHARRKADSPNPCSRRVTWLAAFLVATAIVLPRPSAAQDISPQKLPGLQAEAKIKRDNNDIPHIQAANEHDMALLQGYVHAQDRLFQMDVSRREASGTLAELVGPAAVAQDVQLRTLGLRRAAQRSLTLQSPRVQVLLRAYADGINAWVSTHPLPPEYGALELIRFQPWTALDSLAVAKLIAFGLSFDLSDIQATTELLSFQQAGQAAGFDGTKLFFEDIERSAPFDPASTVPDASIPLGARAASKVRAKPGVVADALRGSTLTLAKAYLQKAKDIPLLRHAREQQIEGASNEWVIGGALSATGVPLLANDPHLSLGEPSTWYPVHLQAGDLDVIGNGFPGTPGITLGHNHFVSWGATNDGIDVTDVFQEQVVPDSTSPSGLSSVFQGKLEHIIPVPEVFRQNNIGDGIPDNLTTVPAGGAIPAATLIVPRRNNGPIISLNMSTGAALSVQWTGFSGSRELDAVLIWASARNLDGFKQGLAFFSTPQNIAYSDVSGNIAYFGVGEMPVREDLQAGAVNGLPPFFIRNGAGGNEWLPVIHPQPNQAIPFEILPASEMPHIINPAAGFFVNSNNDPLGVTLGNNPLGRLRPGGGIYYLGYTFDAGFRSGRITELIRQKIANDKISFAEVQAIQADVVLHDAEFFVPLITQAFDHALAHAALNPQLAQLSGDPTIVEAVGRLRVWDFTTPSGLPRGYDGGDANGPPFPRSGTEIANSVAATLYSVWRGQFVSENLGTTLAGFGLASVAASVSGQSDLKALRHLLENFSTTHGSGASGVNFFQVSGVADAGDSRDIVILRSLRDTLTLLASPAFAGAFAGSANQNDYRWGKLHRITFAHLLGAPFSIPPAGGAFPQPLPNLPGIPTDGGYQTVDAASHSVTAASVDGFTFGFGPSQRFVSEARNEGMHGVSSLPGGVSGVLGSPFYVNLLLQWLTNHAYDQLFRQDELEHNILNVTTFVPGIP